MINRPLVIFGAAFLVTALAALFAPLLLLFIALPCAFGLLFLRGQPRAAVVMLSLGCLTAILVSGLFFVRLGHSRALVGSTQLVSGNIFYDGGRQMAVLTMQGGKRRVAELFPQAEGLETGDGISGTVTVTEATADDSSHLLSGGILLTCEPDQLVYMPDTTPPPAIRGMLLREQLCSRLRLLVPTPATDITVAILFSVKTYIKPELRNAFSNSGMAHLLAVSGLHLSILVLTLVAGVRRLGGGKLLQTIVGGSAALLVFFAAGMSPSVFRATLMMLLTLLAGLISRKSDGLTSLSVAAVILVGISPPVIAGPSFLLSFTSVAGILLLSPRFLTVLERLWVSRFSHCGKAARWVLSALSVSAAAQLATAPVVAVCFGSFPLLGIFINLVAIPLVYPVLVFGFAACLALFAAPALAVALLFVANLCSTLLGYIADLASGLPFCTLPVVFPSDLLPIIFLALVAVMAAIFPHRVRLLCRLAPILTAGAVLSAVLNAIIAYNSITVATSAVTGSIIIADRSGSLVIDNTQSEYHRTLDSDLLLRLGEQSPDSLVVPYPYDTEARIASAALHYGTAEAYTSAQLTAPIELLAGVWASVPQPYLTEITICNTKLMKFYATYDTIDKLDIDGNDTLLVDRQGNMLSLGGRRYVFRRKNGESFTRIYRSMGE